MTSENDWDEVAQLRAEQQIRTLRARYFRLLDTKDWEGFAELFTDDATLETGEDLLGPGGAAIAATVRASLDVAETVHHGHTPEIDITSPTTATGIWAAMDLLRFPEGSPVLEMTGYGHYHETYERSAEIWRIKRLVVKRLRVDTR